MALLKFRLKALWSLNSHFPVCENGRVRTVQLVVLAICFTCKQANVGTGKRLSGDQEMRERYFRRMCSIIFKFG